MSSLKIREGIYWVGAIDRDVRIFHGYKTPEGTTYNAYLVIDEKITLVDTVKAPFTQEMWDRIAEIVNPEDIDILISNHVEPDHSGALPHMASRCPKAEIYTSPNGEKGLGAYYPELAGREMKVVKTGDTLNTGKYTFSFVLMPMVHWPDSMATYLAEEKILFSNDAFGQHTAADERFDDELGLPRLMERAGDYYANIVLPYGAQVQKVLAEVAKIPVEMICPSHGVILRSHVDAMVEKYSYWSAYKSDDKKAAVIYDTMWGATREMAEKIAEDYRAEGIEPELVCLGDTHYSTAMTKTLEAKYISIGSSTLNKNVMPTVAAFLAYFKGLNPQNRVGQAFGAFGWGGESVKIIEETLSGMGYEMRPSVKAKWRPVVESNNNN